jgi:hypothetical protein
MHRAFSTVGFRASFSVVARAVLPIAIGVASSACYVRGAGALPFFLAETAIVAAVIVSTTPPPPPRVVYVPAPRPGYAWQSGYWTKQEGDWVWVEGQWIALQPGYAWVPTHWEQVPDGSWRLVAGHWVQASP